MAESIKNFFAGDASKENIRQEKLKILRLVAEHGMEGKQIYREAQRRTAGRQVADTGKAEAGGVSVPDTVISEVRTERTRLANEFRDQMDRAAFDQQQGFDRLATSEELFHDGAVGDAANLERLANERIEQFEISDQRRRAAAAKEKSGFDTGFLSDALDPVVTLPEDFLNINPNSDPEGLLAPVRRRTPATAPTTTNSRRSSGTANSSSFGRGSNRPATGRVRLDSGSTLGAIADVQRELADDAGLVIRPKSKRSNVARVPRFLQ